MHNNVLNLINALKEKQNSGLNDPLFVSMEQTFQEIEFILNDNYIVEGKGIGTALGIGAVTTGIGAVAARNAANQAASTVFPKVNFGNFSGAMDAYRNARDLESIAQILGTSAGLLAVAGIGYGIYRLFSNISRSKELIKKYEFNKSSVKDSKAKAAINEKIQNAKDKLALAQERAKKEKAKEMQKTQDLKDKLNQLKSSKNPNKQEIDKLQKKLDARMKVMSKIDSIIK